MKVKDLIIELQKLNQDYNIVLANDGGWQNDIPIRENEQEKDCYIIEGLWF
jgi:hypothetical protein